MPFTPARPTVNLGNEDVDADIDNAGEYGWAGSLMQHYMPGGDEGGGGVLDSLLGLRDCERDGLCGMTGLTALPDME